MSIEETIEDAVSVLTLNRPDVLNAFDDEMGSALVDSVGRAAADLSIRCIVITGAGRAFSSGEDLGALTSVYGTGTPPDLGATLRDRYNPLVRAIRAAPKPVVAAVNGVAAGAGASIALACDFRLASERAKLVFAFVRVGLVPDSGALWFLSNMVGASKAWELAATGNAVSAEEARRLGIFHQVITQDEFGARWLEFARELAAGPTAAYALMKRLINDVPHSSLDDQLEREVDAQTAAGRTTDHAEGVRAFLDKRPAVFRGE
ncbi:MAG TPA: enoyl-CoA hydratase-related protein [Actinomycetota bacterium]|nr:enoyl-CoA hydratase-related protein [Actinomycetota bacterium]